MLHKTNSIITYSSLLLTLTLSKNYEICFLNNRKSIVISLFMWCIMISTTLLIPSYQESNQQQLCLQLLIFNIVAQVIKMWRVSVELVKYNLDRVFFFYEIQTIIFSSILVIQWSINDEWDMLAIFTVSLAIFW